VGYGCLIKKESFTFTELVTEYGRLLPLCCVVGSRKEGQQGGIYYIQ
jgi:hypothetical protein